MLKYFAIICLVALLFFTPACDEVIETTGPSTVTFDLSAFKVPTRLNTLVPAGATPQRYDIAFRVTHPDGNDAISSVSAQFYSADQSQLLVELPLYDDGGVEHPGDRDVVANDGVFSNSFTINDIGLAEGEYALRGFASDRSNESRNSAWLAVSAIANTAPVLVTARGQDTLQPGMPFVPFLVTVQDSNEVDDIAAVEARLMRGALEVTSVDLSFNQALSADSAIYQLSLDSSFAAERQGDYTLEFQARDVSDALSNIISRPFFLENSAPRLFNLTLPDTVIRPSGSEVAILMTINADDGQGLSDIDSVYFNSILPNGNPATNNPFVVYDNGLPFDPGNNPEAVGDLVEGDGVYSRTILVFNTTETGKYIFSFFARDKVGNFTVGAVDSIFILP